MLFLYFLENVFLIFFYIFRLFYLFLLSILSIFSSAILLERKDSNSSTNNSNNNNNNSSINIKVMKQKQPKRRPSVGPKGPGKVFLVLLCSLNLSFLIFTACFLSAQF